MIKSFKQSWLKEFWDAGKHKRVPDHLKSRLTRKLDMLNTAKELRDLSSPPSNNLHQLHGDRMGQWAISVNGPGDYALSLNKETFSTSSWYNIIKRTKNNAAQI
jgi:proteic killer suppression protein